MGSIYGKLSSLRGDDEGTGARLDRGYDDGCGNYTLFAFSRYGISLIREYRMHTAFVGNKRLSARSFMVSFTELG
jgi:hypothetical protein